MIYLSHFEFPDREQEYDFTMGQKHTCYDTFYPFLVLSKHGLKMLDFEPVTILYGGNGSGKSTALNVIAEKSGLSKSECNRVLEILSKQGEIAKTHRTLIRYEDATPEEQRYCKVLIDKWNRAWVSLTIAYETSVLSLFGGVLRFWNKPKHSPISRSRRHTVRHDLSTDAARYFAMMEIDDALAARRTYKNVR